MRFTNTICLLASCILVALVAAPSPAGPTSEKFSAVAYLPSGGRTANVDIIIDGYTSDQQAQQLQSLLFDSGPNAVLKALDRMPRLGKIQGVGRLSFYDFKVVRSQSTPQGRHIVAVADRPISFLEAYYNTRSKDYRFGVMELDLHNDGDHEVGEGQLIYAAKVKVVGPGQIEVENYGIDPVRLIGVRRL
jgi:hypothetical protein